MKKVKPKTTNDTCCPIFGSPADLRENVLPTLGDITKYYLFVRHQKKTDADAREPSIVEISETVATRCELLWQKASIPTIGHKRIVEKIRTNNEKYQNMLKPFKSRKGDQKYQTKLKSYAMECNSQLFDIAACKCYNETMCTC